VPEAVDPPAGAGIGGAPLQLIAGEGAAALVSDLPEAELRVGREELTVHARVLERALAQGTVLPMRFGVVMAGEAAVRRHVLDAHAGRDQARQAAAEATEAARRAEQETTRAQPAEAAALAEIERIRTDTERAMAQFRAEA